MRKVPPQPASERLVVRPEILHQVSPKLGVDERITYGPGAQYDESLRDSRRGGLDPTSEQVEPAKPERAHLVAEADRANWPPPCRDTDESLHDRQRAPRVETELVKGHHEQ